MDRRVGAAARLPESDRKELAVQAMVRSETVSDLATRHGVSRKFVYAQKRKASIALDDAFLSAAAEDEVLFELVVTKAWLCQVIVALALICHGSYRGVIESCVTCSAYPSVSAPFTTSSIRPRSGPVSSTRIRTCQAFLLAYTMRFSRDQCPSWPASVRRRLTATFWSRRNIATPIPGACICSTPAGRG